MNEIDVKYFISELKKRSLYDFSDYSYKSINRRIVGVVEDYKLSVNQILKQVSLDRTFAEKLVSDITVNTTSFFRDSNVWVNLANSVYPSLFYNDKINIWHAGCSSGKEVYSNLILLSELGLIDKVDIVATDISKEMLSVAKKATYQNFYLDNIQKQYNHVMDNTDIKNYNDISKYIDEENNYVTIKKELRDKVKFYYHDLVSDNETPFFQKFDIIFCRNVLIYFNPELQNKIVGGFLKKLYGKGFLLIGASEQINGAFKTRFVNKCGVYCKNKQSHFFYK